MQFSSGDKDTICAVSSAPGRGGISVIRVSGPNAASILRPFCAFFPSKPESHRVYFGTFKEINTRLAVDEVLLTYFAHAKSYTGEETVEISCHGNPTITAEVLRQLVTGGCRVAMPGEFTFRAFMNGRIDLVQAESVLSVIESQSKKAVSVALKQLKGELSKEIESLEDSLIWIMAHLEAGIDFSSEDIEWEEQKTLQSKARAELVRVRLWLEGYKAGRILREGCQVALVGRPNVGKSSLLNAILGEDKAIVTDEPGTTRDRIEAQKLISGVLTEFVDTAGLRETTVEVEKIGIARAYEAIKSADIVFFVFDLCDGLLKEERAQLLQIKADKVLVIGNKLDASEPKDIDVPGFDHLNVSAKTGEGLAEVEKYIANYLSSVGAPAGSDLFQARHYEILRQVEVYLHAGVKLLEKEESPELPAFEIQAALKLVYEIRGKVFDDEVLDRVFNDFCLGK